jgi:plasmid stabilization system protein ParE
MRVLRRPRFLLDLAEELTMLNERAGAHVAEAWYASLKETIHQLQLHPYLGRERKDLLVPGIRSWRLSRFPRWLIFYEVTETSLILYRIRQGTMDLAVLRMKS